MTDFFFQPFTLYTLLGSAWRQPALAAAFMLLFAMRILQQWFYYAEPGQRHPIWKQLEGGPRGKHTLDAVADPVIYLAALAGGIDLVLFLGIAMVGSQYIQWFGVHWGEGLPALWRGEKASYEVLGIAIPKPRRGWRVAVAAVGTAIFFVRAALLCYGA